MSTAEVRALHQQDPVDQMINRTVKALLAVRDMDPDTFRERAHLPRSTYYNRMSGRNGWSASEVKRAADALGVSVATLYDGLSVAGAGFEPATSGSRAQHARLAEIIPFPMPRLNVEAIPA